MLCMQTTDTSIELYWHDGLLHSRHSSTPQPVHIPVIEDFVDRVARKMTGGEGALLFEAINRNASAHFVGGIPDRREQRERRRRPLPAAVRPARPPRDGRKRRAGQPGGEPVADVTALAERAMSLWPNRATPT